MRTTDHRTEMPRDRSAGSNGSGTTPGALPTLRFARAARAVADEAHRLGLRAPGFRSPPGLQGSDRTIRRAARGAVVSVRLHDRPFEAVLADMVEGVVVANDLERDDARRTRVLLLQALVGALSGPDSPAEAA